MGEDLDEGLMGARREKEGSVDEGEGVERDAGWGEESEVEIEGVVEESSGEEAALGGDKGGRGPFCGLGGDCAAGEDAGEGDFY